MFREGAVRNEWNVGAKYRRQARTSRNVLRHLERLEASAKKCEAARPELHTFCFISGVDKKVVSTSEMGTGK